LVVAAALAGFGLILYVSSTNTLIQLTVEDRFRGRVMSLYTLFLRRDVTVRRARRRSGGAALGRSVATSICAVVLLAGALWVSLRLRGIAAREAAAREAAAPRRRARARGDG